MSASKVILIILAVIVAGGVLVGGCVYSGYNRAIRLDEATKSAWAQVENQLQRRYDLVPNLVETVKGVAAQEEKIYLGVAEARKAWAGARTVDEKALAAGRMESALARLLMIQEAYPQLRSNESFMKLQDQLEGTENRLSVERKRYNDAVQGLNTFVRTITGRIYAGLAGVGKAEYFEIVDAAKAVPKVDFSRKPPGQ